MTGAAQLKIEYGPAEYGAELADFAALHYGSKAGHRGRVLIAARPIGGGDPVLQFACFADQLPEALAAYEIDARRDYYITGNTFAGKRWLHSQLFALQNIVIDIDAHGIPDRAARSALIDKLIRQIRAELRPLPASIVYTGRGVQLWYAIEPESYKAERRYITVREDILRAAADLLQGRPEFKALQIDTGASNNAASLYRLPYTYNTKTAGETPAGDPIRGHVLRIHGDRLKLSREVKRIAAAQSRSKADKKSGLYRLPRKGQETATERAAQLFALQRIRRAAGVPAGAELRNNNAFCLYNILAAGEIEHETIMAEVMRLNAGFIAPLREREIINNLGSSRRKYEREGRGYPISDGKITELLQITEAERREIWISRGTKRERDRQARRDAKEARNAEIVALYQQGKTQEEIAAALNCSHQTAGRVLKAAGIKTPAEYLRAKVCELYAQGYKAAEIADITGVTTRTVYKHISKARAAGEIEATDGRKAPAGEIIDRAAEKPAEAKTGGQDPDTMKRAAREAGQLAAGAEICPQSAAKDPAGVFIQPEAEKPAEQTAAPQAAANEEGQQSTAGQPAFISVPADRIRAAARVVSNCPKRAFTRRGNAPVGPRPCINIHPAGQEIPERIHQRRPVMSAEQTERRRQLIEHMRRNREKWAAQGLESLPLPWPAREDPDRLRE